MKSRYLYHYPSFSEHFPTQTSAPPPPVPHSSDRSSLLVAIPHRRRIFRPKSPVHWTNRRLGDDWQSTFRQDGFAIFGWISYGIRILWDLPWIPNFMGSGNWFSFWKKQFVGSILVFTGVYMNCYSVIECQNITWILRASILKQLVSSVAGCFFPTGW